MVYFACFSFRMQEGMTGKLARFADVWSRSIAVLLFLSLCFPLSLAVCSCCFLIGKLLILTGVAENLKKDPCEDISTKCILILAGSKCKALHMCRLFKREGYVTIICETKKFPIVAAGWSVYCDYFYKLDDPFKAPNEYERQFLHRYLCT